MEERNYKSTNSGLYLSSPSQHLVKLTYVHIFPTLSPHRLDIFQGPWLNEK